MDDGQLLAAQLLSGDTAVLATLIDVYASDVHAVVTRCLRGATPEDVEETVADVFVRVWEHPERYDPERGSLRAWLLMHARFAALDKGRQRRRRRRLPWAPDDRPPDMPEQVLASADERRRVQGALDHLPPLDKEIVYRRYFLNEPTAALAASLGLSRQAVHNRLWRARQVLRTLLDAPVDTGREADGSGRHR